MEVKKVDEVIGTRKKALEINLDPTKYGTFGEIGAGQEVARYFFQAGGAAGTIAKSMSAYDMAFSDAIYGPEEGGRYVVESRLMKMLDYEYDLIIQRLNDKRGKDTCFFVFADTVAAKSFKSNRDCHGWIGIKFQTKPLGPANYICLHVRMFDEDAVQQQEALGIVGVNLIYGAFYYQDDPSRFIRSLADNLSSKRVEIDVVKFSGPNLKHIDNRLMALQLIEHELSNVAMFNEKGEIIQPSEVLHKKALMVQRGSFRPPTHVNIDMFNCALDKFKSEPLNIGVATEVFMEITLNNLKAEGGLNHPDFLSRVDILTSLGFKVMISNYSEFYRLVHYLGRFTPNMISLVIGIPNLMEIFDEKYYEKLEGGILEAMGRLFKRLVKFYVYPYKDPSSGEFIQIENFPVKSNLNHLFQYLVHNHYIENLNNCSLNNLHIFSREVLKMIREGNNAWEKMLPDQVAKIIKEKKLFGYK